jgi:hypothetical protein
MIEINTAANSEDQLATKQLKTILQPNLRALIAKEHLAPVWARVACDLCQPNVAARVEPGLATPHLRWHECMCINLTPFAKYDRI